jgi:hypothetical protein
MRKAEGRGRRRRRRSWHREPERLITVPVGSSSSRDPGGDVATRGAISGFWPLINLILNLINAFELYLTF